LKVARTNKAIRKLDTVAEGNIEMVKSTITKDMRKIIMEIKQKFNLIMKDN
jgi:hypothetical protein